MKNVFFIKWMLTRVKLISLIILLIVMTATLAQSQTLETVASVD